MAKKEIHSVHFIGIGGIGMSGIALVAKAQGMQVSGSDLRHSSIIKQLKKNGIKIYIGNREENIASGKDKPDIVVVSTAIMDHNPELKAAKDAKIPIWHRAELLAYLGRNKKTLAVTGTHGKTSTSSMLASALHQIGDDPSFLIGGVVRPFGTNAQYGDGEYYVVEADESDKSFTYLSPYAAIITNIEADHLDHYKDMNEIYDKFEDFIKLLPKNGLAVCSGDDAELTKITKKVAKNVITYGFGDNCDAKISKYKTSGVGCTFKLDLPVFKVGKSKRKEPVSFDCSLPKNPGIHYAENAASVVVLLDALGYDAKKVVEALENFGGIKRRFDVIGSEAGVTVVDDYAHHPTEIAATVKAAFELDFKNVHVIWQPHRFSRIGLFRDIFNDEFAHAFDGCKTVTFTNVYGAGEVPVPGVTGYSFLKIVKDKAGKKSPKTHYVPHRLEIVDHICGIAEDGDLVITMGAGDITSMAPQILQALKEKSK